MTDSSIDRLDIGGLRNLADVSIRLSPHLNLLSGSNGSGKTSVLEAIHILALGRSFRSTRLEPLIQHGRQDFHLFARFNNGDTAGVQKSLDSSARLLKYNGQKQDNWQALVAALPVQLFNTDSFSLLEGGARIRRHFLDWGVFHVEHGFLSHWREAVRCLRHRNALLKQGRGSASLLRPWDELLIERTEQITVLRQAYFDTLLDYLAQAVSELAPDLGDDVRFSFYRGWPADQDFVEALNGSRERDLRYGATQRGPHRADIRVRVHGQPAAQVLSRGQQKMLVCAMKLAEIRSLLAGDAATPPVLLVDDIAAELDAVNRRVLVEKLVALRTQVLFTAITPQELPWLSEFAVEASMQFRQFHVEHGKIAQY